LDVQIVQILFCKQSLMEVRHCFVSLHYHNC